LFSAPLSAELPDLNASCFSRTPVLEENAAICAAPKAVRDSFAYFGFSFHFTFSCLSPRTLSASDDQDRRNQVAGDQLDCSNR
jgi:hypothetical protein